jgi:hypothetical protein
MYDMYPWDSRADGARSRTSRTDDPIKTATAAVQAALDRRDNGGETTWAGQ